MSVEAAPMDVEVVTAALAEGAVVVSIVGFEAERPDSGLSRELPNEAAIAESLNTTHAAEVQSAPADIFSAPITTELAAFVSRRISISLAAEATAVTPAPGNVIELRLGRTVQRAQNLERRAAA